MCLLVLAWQAHPRYRLVVAANRDEYHERAAAALAKWPPPAALIAGRDLRAQGTWLGVDRERRFGVVTNFRQLPPPPAPGTPRRAVRAPQCPHAGGGRRRAAAQRQRAAARLGPDPVRAVRTAPAVRHPLLERRAARARRPAVLRRAALRPARRTCRRN